MSLKLESETTYKNRLNNPSDYAINYFNSWMHGTKDLSKKDKLLHVEIGIAYLNLTESYFNKKNKISFHNILSDIIKENYSEIASDITNRLDSYDLGLLAHPLIRADHTKRFAQKIIDYRNEFFSKLAFESRKSFSSGVIDMSPLSYMSYDTTEGMLAYAQSTNNKNYTLNADAERLFKELNSQDVFDGENLKIHLLFSGLSFQEMGWAYAINKKNNNNIVKEILSGIDGRQFLGAMGYYGPNNITSIDASIVAQDIHNIFSGELILPINKILSTSEIKDYFNNLSSKKKHVVIKHNGLNCESLDKNIEEMSLLRNTIKSKNATTFYTLPTTHSLTTKRAYAGSDILFPYATLNSLLLLNKSQLSNFIPEVLEQKINPDSFRYLIGFRVTDNVRFSDQYAEQYLTLSKGTFLGLHSSNRYGKNTINKMSQISGRRIFGSFESGMQALY